MHFTKVQSIGNDFVLVEMSEVDSVDLPRIAQETADRHFSVGSDGLLAIACENGRLVLRMFNTDGSEDFCGNGIRCAALYGFQKGWTGRKADICHFGQCVHTEILEGGRVRSEFEPASFEPNMVPITADREFYFQTLEVESEQVVGTAVTTGSTHFVIFCEDLPDDERFERLGRAIEHHPLFPERTSVIWAKAESTEEGSDVRRVRRVGTFAGIEGEAFQSSRNPGFEGMDGSEARGKSDTMRIRIWERGVGETQGCGTGSAAVAAVYVRALKEGFLGFQDSRVSGFQVSDVPELKASPKHPGRKYSRGYRHASPQGASDAGASKPWNPGSLESWKPDFSPTNPSNPIASPIYLKNPGGTVEVSMNSIHAPIITSAIAEIVYAAIY